MTSKPAPAVTTQINETKLPAWVEAASQENYGLAKQVADRPFEQYQGDRVAAESPLTTQGYDYVKSSIGALDPYYKAATDAFGRSTDFQNSAAGLFNKASQQYDSAAPLYGKAEGAVDTAGKTFGNAADIYRSTAGPLDINRFLNPYTNEVEGRAIDNANRSLTGNLNSITDKQKLSHAFGGSRGSIENAVTRAEGTRGIGDLSAQLRKAGIDFATNTALADRSGVQAAAAGLTGVGSGQLGQGAGYLNTAGGIREGAAGQVNAGQGMLGASTAATGTGAGYLNTAASKGQNIGDEIARLFGAGGQQEAHGQKVIDAAMTKFNEARNNPVDALNIRLAALGMSPYGKTESGTKTSTSERLPTDWATVGLGAFKTALPFLSDRNAKTDIKKVGDDPLAGIPIYSYRYKGDPKTYPKMVGPMAQDVEKKFPEAVTQMGRYKAIDMAKLMEVLA